MTAPSVDEVMRRLSSRAPSMRWVGASDEMIQLSMTEPTVEPISPPMAAPERPRIAPPKPMPMLEPTTPSTRVAMAAISLRRGTGRRRRCAAARWG